MGVAVWVWLRTRPTPLVGRVAWQEQGQTKKKELEGMTFDLAALQLKAIPPGKYILRNIRRAGPFLVQEGREPRRLEHNQHFEEEGIKFTYLEY